MAEGGTNTAVPGLLSTTPLWPDVWEIQRPLRLVLCLACWVFSPRCIDSWAQVASVVALYQALGLSWYDVEGSPSPTRKSAAPYATRASPLYSAVIQIGDRMPYVAICAAREEGPDPAADIRQ